MKKSRTDVAAVGNAIVDVLARADDAFLEQNGLQKGTMALIEAERAAELYAAMGPAHEISGGSAANTAVGLASLGSRATFIGKVRNDQLGGIFRHDIRAAGVIYQTMAASEGPPTARSLVFITPDAQRTMCTYLGVSVELAQDDLDLEMIAESAVTYLEGYLWDSEAAKAAFLKAARVAHGAGGKVALTLSDPTCVARHRRSFLELARHHVDILFANEHEICALLEVEDFDLALQQARDLAEVVVLTRSERGSLVLADDEVNVIDAVPPSRLVDTTGAGDLYAAGFLHGMVRGEGWERCGRIGALVASEIVSHYGARPERGLEALVREQLGDGQFGDGPPGDGRLGTDTGAA